MATDQRLRRRKSWEKTSWVKDLARIFAAAAAVSIVLVVLILMMYWIQSILEFPRHLSMVIEFLDII